MMVVCDGCVFAEVVQRMHHGAGYYDAMGAVMRVHDMPTLSVFNWRPPLVFWLASLSPWTWPNWALYSEIWAGILIATALLIRKSHWGVAAGMLIFACAIRELAIPVLVLVLVDDVLTKPTRAQAWGWMLLGLTNYYGLHWTSAAAAMLPSDWGGSVWLGWWGPRTVLETLGGGVVPIWLSWAMAVGLGAAVLSSTVDPMVRLVVVLYAAAFAFVGGPQHEYWGLVMLPTQELALIQLLLGRDAKLRQKAPIVRREVVFPKGLKEPVALHITDRAPLGHV